MLNMAKGKNRFCLGPLHVQQKKFTVEMSMGFELLCV